MDIWWVVKQNLACLAVYLTCGTASSRIAKQVLIEKTGSLQTSLGMLVPAPVAGVFLAEFSTGLDQALCLFSSDKTCQNWMDEHQGTGTCTGSRVMQRQH